MNNFTPEISEKMVQYLDGELSDSERKLLEEELSNDSAMQEAMDNLRAIRKTVGLYGLKNKISTIHNEMMEKEFSNVKRINTRKRIWRYVTGIAASILLLIGAYFVFNNSSVNSEKVFADNFKSYEHVNNRDITTNESEIVKNYRDKKYKEVTTIFYDRGFTTEEIFLRAMSFAELNQGDSAVASFKMVITENQSATIPVYNDEAEYYLALQYIRNKQYKEALVLLNKIKTSASHLYNKGVSEKLIRNVEKLNSQ